MEPPFTITPEAREELARAGTIPGMEIGIMRGLRFEIRNKEDQLTDQFEGEHFSIVYDNVADWLRRSAVSFMIDGRSFWLVPGTVEKLKGRTLTVLRRYEGEKQIGRTRNVLVAA